MKPILPKTSAHRLSNGMTVLLRESHDVPVATADLWVKTGSADEPPFISGISHFLEHMLFKGTSRFKTGEIEREIENAGGVCNAGTSYDFTHYYITLPAMNLQRGIEMLGEMATASALDPQELEKERLVILEEYRRKQDNPAAMLYEDLYEQLFTAGPYHRAVIGSEETIRSITRKQMADYYHRQYAPANMALILSGDVRAEEALPMAEKAFGAPVHSSNGKYFECDEAHERTAVTRYHREKETGGELYLALACPGPGIKETDRMIALDLAQFILGQGRASILYQEIKEKQQLASTVSCHFSPHRIDSIFMIIATTEPAKREALSRALRERLKRFKSEPIPADQLHRARRLLSAAHLFSFETSGGASSEVGYYYTMTGGMDFLNHYLERLEAATPDSVREAFSWMLDSGAFIETTVGPVG